MDKEWLSHILEKFLQKRILIIGDVMVDIYQWGNVSRISPEAPVPVVSCKNTENRLGGAANVALNIKSMGAIPILCAVTGNDKESALFRKLLHDHDITDEGIIEDPQRKTTSKTRIIGDNQHLLRIDNEIDDYLSNEYEQKLIARIESYIHTKQVDTIIFQDYDKGVISAHLIDYIVDVSRHAGIPTLVDPKKRNFLHYHKVNLFKPNFKEFKEGLKVDIDKSDTGTIFEIASKFQERNDIEYLLLTLSDKGIFISDKKSYHSVPARQHEITDVSGAGDTVISVASLCLASGLGPDKIAEISNLAGGLVCEKVGVVPITREMILS